MEETQLRTDALSADDLKQIALNAKKENREKNIERIRSGQTDAIKHIINGYQEKMLKSANNGETYTLLYTFGWVDDPTQSHDSNGNKTLFEGNVRIRDLILFNKGRHFLKELTEQFNIDGENKYHCYIRKILEKDGTSSWNIYVSWANNLRKDNSGGRGYGRGGGRGRGRDYERNNRSEDNSGRNRYQQNDRNVNL